MWDMLVTWPGMDVYIASNKHPIPGWVMNFAHTYKYMVTTNDVHTED